MQYQAEHVSTSWYSLSSSTNPFTYHVLLHAAGSHLAKMLCTPIITHQVPGKLDFESLSHLCPSVRVCVATTWFIQHWCTER